MARTKSAVRIKQKTTRVAKSAQPNLTTIGRQTLGQMGSLAADCAQDVARHVRREWLHIVAIARLVGRANVEIASVGKDGLVQAGVLLRDRVEGWTANTRSALASVRGA